MGTPEEESARVRAEIVEEMKAEEAGEPSVDVDVPQQRKAVDPWEGVNPALKQAFDEMSSRVETLKVTEARLKQAESRIGAITNEMHSVKKAAAEAPTSEQMQAAAASDEKWESLKKDFPEWAEAFDGRFDKKLTAKVRELRDELEGKIKGGENLDLRLLNMIKPNWKKTVATPEWKEWLALQSPESAARVSSDKAEDATAIISEFEASRGQKTATEIAAERKQRIKGAVLPQGGKAIPVKSEADMSAAELRANIGREIYAET